MQIQNRTPSTALMCLVRAKFFNLNLSFLVVRNFSRKIVNFLSDFKDVGPFITLSITLF